MLLDVSAMGIRKEACQTCSVVAQLYNNISLRGSYDRPKWRTTMVEGAGGPRAVNSYFIKKPSLS